MRLVAIRLQFKAVREVVRELFAELLAGRVDGRIVDFFGFHDKFPLEHTLYHRIILLNIWISNNVIKVQIFLTRQDFRGPRVRFWLMNSITATFFGEVTASSRLEFLLNISNC